MNSKLINYVKLELNEQTTERLYDYCRINKLGLFDQSEGGEISAGDFKFHITVIFSKVAHPKFVDEEHKIYPLSFSPDSLQMFGVNYDVLAIKMKREKLFSNLVEYYRSSYGYVSDFPCNPHVSIRGSCADYAERLLAIPIPNFSLIAEKLVHQVKVLD